MEPGRALTFRRTGLNVAEHGNMTLIWCQDQVHREPLQPKSNPHLTPWKNGMNMENLLRACHQPLPVPLNEHGSLKLYIIHHGSMRQMPAENPIKPVEALKWTVWP